MIVAFSTSSPQASVALLSEDGSLIWSGRREAPRAASGACLALLEEGLKATGATLSDATAFLADLGPGSFTGVRVGVTLAKTFAFAQGVKAGGADAFDLIDPVGTVVLPSKRGEWFIRDPGVALRRSETLDPNQSLGWGTGFTAQTYPDAANFGPILNRIAFITPELLVPVYLIEPSISTPKRPYGAPVAQ